MKIALPLSFFITSCLLLSQSRALQLGQPVGAVPLLSPENLPVLMNNYSERNATAVLFLSARDKPTAATASKISLLNHKLHEHAFLMVGIFPDESQTPAEIRAYSQAHGFNFPVYRDPGGKATAKFGASVTPEVFLLNHAGKLVYRGGIDGLTDAMASLRSGKPFPLASTKISGTPIGTHLPPATVIDPYGKIQFSSELIFEKIPNFPVHHCSTITEAGNGDLLVSWYGGSYESSDDQVLFISRRKKGQRNWSTPEILVRSPGHPPGNALLFTDKTKRIWLVWGRMDGTQPMNRGTGWDACRLFARTSSDNGYTWSKDEPFYGDTLGWLPRNLSITLNDGRLIVPMSDELHGHGVDWSFFLSTADNGKTWLKSGLMKGGEQPTFIQRADSSLLAYLRVRPNIVASESHDGGKTWTDPKATQWKNPDSGISMRRLANGHVLLVFNNQDDARSPLHIARSTDDAHTWESPLILETNPGEYSYPSVLQTLDGKIHIIYTYRRYSIKHVELNEYWLTHFERPD